MVSRVGREQANNRSDAVQKKSGIICFSLGGNTLMVLACYAINLEFTLDSKVDFIYIQTGSSLQPRTKRLPPFNFKRLVTCDFNNSTLVNNLSDIS